MNLANRSSRWLRDQLLRRGIEVRRVGAQAERSAGYSRFAEDEIVGRLLSAREPVRFCVDIGAGDGVVGSNIKALTDDGWSGLAVEWGPRPFASLAHSYIERPAVDLVRLRVTPTNVTSILAAHATPHSFGFLSLDIDSYDHAVLDAVLGEYHPTLVCAEINEKIPPPVRFSVDYRENDFRAGGHFYGMSLSSLDVIARSHGYRVVELEYNNAFLQPSELTTEPARSIDELYRSGYLDRPDRLQRLPWNADMEELQHLAPEDAVRWIHNRFAEHAGRYTCEA